MLWPMIFRTLSASFSFSLVVFSIIGLAICSDETGLILRDLSRDLSEPDTYAGGRVGSPQCWELSSSPHKTACVELLKAMEWHRPPLAHRRTTYTTFASMFADDLLIPIENDEAMSPIWPRLKTPRSYSYRKRNLMQRSMMMHSGLLRCFLVEHPDMI